MTNRLRRFAALALLALAALPAAAGDAPGVIAHSGDKIVSQVDAGDTDGYSLDLSEDGAFSLRLKGSTGLLPAVQLLRPDGTPASPTLIGAGKPAVKLNGFHPDATGTWRLLVSGAPGTAGACIAKFAVTLPTVASAKKHPVPASGTTILEFTGNTGATAKITINPKIGSVTGARVLGPSGDEVPGSAALFVLTPNGKLTAKSVPLAHGFGRYRVELTGGVDGATADVSVKVKFAPIAKRKAVLPPEPTVASVSPGIVRQGSSGVSVTVAGANLLADTEATIDGDGVTIDGVSGTGAAANVLVTVADDAPYGAHTLVLCPPPLLAEQITLPAAFVVHAPDPALASSSLAVVKQGDASLTLDMTGAGFRTGGALTVTGTGLTLGATEVLSPTLARATVTAAADATVGPRDVTYTQPALGGGANVTHAVAFTVHYPDPSVTAIAPTVVKQGDSSVVLTLTGNHFRDGGTVSIAGDGFTITNETRLSDTSFQATVAVTGSATFGLRDVTYTQPAPGGGAAASLSSALQVDAPAPTVMSATPVIVKQGASSVPVTVTGTNFRSGGAITISGTGLTLGATNVASATSASVNVSVDTAATIGARNVTFTQPAAGGGASATANAALTVNHPDPTFTAISPNAIVQGQSGVVLTLTGSNFRDNGVVSLGADFTATNATRLSDTSYQVTVDIGAAAVAGARNVTYTQPAGGGGASATLTNGMQVDAATPTVTLVSPTTIKQGQSGVTMTLTGTNFRTGGTITISGTGLTLGSTNVASATSATVDVSASSSATIGARNVTYTQPASAGGASATVNGALTVNHPDPTFTAISPTSVAQGATGVVLTLTGTNFRDGATVGFGADFTVTNAVRLSDTSFQATVNVGAAAAFGARNVTYTQPAAGGGASATLTNGLTVNAPTPTVTAASPVLKQGQSGVTVTVTGTGFRSGGAISFSGTGLTLGTQNVVSATSATVVVTVASNATVGARDVTFTQPASGGSANATGTGLLTVNHPDPTFTAISPTSVTQGASGTVLTLTGTNFRAGAAVTFEATGFTVTGTNLVSDTTFEATVNVSASATLGPSDVVYTQPSAGGSASATLTDGLQVNAPTPTVTAASPVLKQGQSNVTVTVTGTNFRSGGLLSISGGGLTLGTQNVVSATSATVVVTVASNATVGTRDVTFTQPAAGGGAAATGTGVLTVNYPDPTFTAISATSVTQGASGTVLTLTGTNFRAGAGVTFEASGFTVTGTNLVSDTSLQATVNVSASATLGPSDVVYAQPSGGGSASATLTDGLQVNAPAPTVTAASPVLKQGQSGITVTVTGTNFRSGGAISISGTGLTLGTQNVVSSTSATVVVTVASNATVGTRDVTFTQPAAGGGANATGTGLLTVNHPDPMFTAISPTSVGQGATGAVLTLTGTNFRAGAAVTFEAAGFSVTATNLVSDTQFEATVNVSSNATLGASDVVYTQPSGGGGSSATLTDGLQVNAPAPTVTAASPVLKQGQSNVTVTVTGTNFRSGGAISISGTGLTLGTQNVVSATSATVVVNVASNATVGLRDVTFTQPAAGGGANATGTGLLTVNHPDPTFTAISPTSVTQGASGTVLTLTGTNFRAGAGVTFEASGFTVTGTNLVSDTSFQATVNVSASATLGPSDVVYTQPSAGGGASVTLTDGLQVNAPTPTVTAASPVLVQGQSSVTVTVTGTNFRSGGAISISGTGLTVGSTNVSSATSATVSVDVAASATVGARDVTFTQPAAGGGASATLTSGLQVNAPAPTVTAASPVLKQGQSSVTVTVTGTNFRSGGAITISGSGLTLGSTNVVSATSATVDVSAAQAANVGARDVTFTQSAAGGAAAGTGTGVLTVNHPDPTFTAISPTSVTQGASGTVLTLTGTNFRAGAAVTFEATGFSVTSTNLVSDTTFEATVNASASATLGPSDVVYTQPSGGGSASATLTDGLQVNAPTPTVTAASPVLKQGQSGITVTVTGTNFRPGGTLSISGTGLTLGTQNVVSATSATVVVTVASNATAGVRDVTFTQPAIGGGAVGTGTGVLTVNHPDPTFTAISATSVTQGASGTVLTLTGTNFRAGASVSFEATGFSVTGTNFVSDTSFQATVNVASNATLGPSDVVYAQPSGGGSASATLTDGLQVNAPAPTVTAASPVLKQGQSGITVTVTGTNFRSGGAISISGTGLTLGTQNVVSATSATVVVTVASNATVGTRDVTFTQPAAGGGANATGTGLLTVNHPDPTFTAISPTSVTQGASGVLLTLTGTGFRAGAAVSLGAAGVTVTGTNLVSDTSFEATVDVGSTATLGLRDVVYTQPAAGGSASATLTDGVQVNAPTPTVTAASPVLKQGQSGITVTVTGTNFRPGGTLSISGSGLTLGTQNVVSATSATVVVNVASNATVGVRDVTFTQPAIGGSAAGTGTGVLTVNHPDPTFTAISPTSVTQGANGVVLTLTGTNFRAGAGVTFEATGFSVTSTNLVSDTSFEATVNVTASATLGPSDVVYTQPSAGGGASATLTDGLQVNAPTPTVTAASPVLKQGQSNVTVTVTGTSFRSGGTITISGSGLTLGSTSVASATSASVQVSAAQAANVGVRDVTFTQPAIGGGAAGTGTGKLTVNHPDPTFTAISPTTVVSGQTGVLLTLTGTNFRAGAGVTFEASGFNVTSTNLVNDTTFEATVDVSAVATLGPSDVTYAQPSAGGGASATLTDGLQVDAPTPTVTAASPALKQGQSNVTVTVTGTNFRVGGTLSISGSGLTLGTQNVSSATSATVVVSVASNAAVGTRDVTFTQPSIGGGAAGTGNRILAVQHPDPTFTSISPTSVIQGQTGVVLTLTGTNFRDSAGVTFEASGFTVTGTNLVSETSFQATVDVDASATLGPSDVVYTQPPGGGSASATLTDGLQVNAPTPTVTAASPVLKQGQSNVTVTVTGTNFRSGGTLSIPGTGLTLGAQNVVSDTSATVVVTVASNATVGVRDVTFTQPAIGGGAAGTGTGKLTVNHPDPTFTSISPTSVVQGQSGVVLTLTGTNFRAGAGVTFEATGFTVTGTNLVNDTSFQATVNVSASATLGPSDVVYTQPAAGGGAFATLTDGLQVNAPTPTVTAASPVLKQGQSNVTVTVTGTNFRSGGSLSIPGTGLTFGAQNVVSDTSATIVVTVASNATVGVRDVTFTQPAIGGGAAGTGTGKLTVNHPDPTFTSIAATSVTQGASGTVLTLTGTNFRAGAAVTFEAAGFTVTGTNLVSDTSFQATVNVSASATLGPSDVVYTQPSAGGGASATLTDGLQVNAPTPTVTAASPVLKQGQSNVTVTATGTNFRSGGSLSIPGTGLTLGTQAVPQDTSATVVVTVASNAPVGTRNVTFTQPAIGGGASGTGTNVLTVNYPDPTISTVSPTTIVQGTSGTFTVTGTNFRSGFALTPGGTGVTLTNLVFTSDTQVKADYSASVSAGLTANTMTYTQPADGGSAAAAKTSAYTVLPPAPTLTSVTPSLWRVGESLFAVHMVGTGFNTGTTVSASGSGLTFTTAGVTSTTLDLLVSVASNASIGARDLTITPGSGGGSAATFTSAATIVPADPVVLTFSAPALAQGATSASVTVTGHNFRSGDVLAASGTGVSFTSVTISSDSQITATAAVNGSAATGPRSISVTHAASEGGLRGTLPNAFTVTSATPSVTSVNPSVIAVTTSGGPTRDVPFTVVGTNFMSGAALSVTKSGGSGVTVKTGSAVVLSDTRLVATLSISPTANTGTWDVLVTNPGTLGNSGTSGNGILTLVSRSTLAVNNVVAPSGSAYGGERVTVYGGGFSAGCVVDFGSARALATQVIDQNTLITTVPQPSSVSSSAPTLTSVKVTLSGGTTSATLTDAYTYAKDDVQLVVLASHPAQGTTGKPGNLQRTAVLLSAPCDTSTAAHGTTNLLTDSLWYGPVNASTGRSFGPLNRWLVLHRTSGTNLNTGTYAINIPGSLRSAGGIPLYPVRFAKNAGQDQYTHGITNGTNDTTAPTLSTASPTNGASNVDPMTKIVLTFSEELDPLTVTSTNITLQQGTTPIGATIEIAADLKKVTLTPDTELASNTQYTVTVTRSVADLCSIVFATTPQVTFTTIATDNVNPVVDRVIIEDLPADMDGSTLYVDSSGASKGFDIFLPRYGFLFDVRFSDQGGSGIDETKFSATCDVKVGSFSAGAELNSLFAITPAGATWRVPKGTDITAAEPVTFTFTVRDLAGNTSSSHVVRFDVIDKDTSAANGGDHDIFDTRQTVILRADLDAYKVTFSGSGGSTTATTTAGTDGADDFSQALRLIGLVTPSMTTESAATANGLSLGTNDIMKRLVLERIRELLRVRYGIAEDGTYGKDSADIEFLLPGERGSLTGLPTYSSSNSYNSSNAYSELSIGGTLGAETGTNGILGQAWIDQRNNFQEANLNDGSSQVTGIYLLGIFKLFVGEQTGTTWRDKILNKFTAGFSGAKPVGEGTDDDEVLAASFDRTAAGNTTAQNKRYDEIMEAVDLVSLLTTAIAAHEVGHSLGLVEDGAPKTGLFGKAHQNNTFTEETSMSGNASFHLNYLGNDIMSASVLLETCLTTGSDLKRFSPMDIAHLRQRLFLDEGR